MSDSKIPSPSFNTPEMAKLLKQFQREEKQRQELLTPEELQAEMDAIKRECDIIKQERNMISSFFGKEIVIRHWARAPGKIVHKETGEELFRDQFIDNDFHFEGTIRQWYGLLNEVILETINLHERMSNSKLSDMFLIVSPDILTILEHTYPFSSVEEYNFGVTISKSGTLFNVPVYKDPFLPPHLVLIATGKPETPLEIISMSAVKVQDMCII